VTQHLAEVSLSTHMPRKVMSGSESGKQGSTFFWNELSWL